MILKVSLTQSDLYQQVIEEKVSYLQELLGFNDRDYFEINLILDEISTNIFENNVGTTNLLVTIEVSCNDGLLQLVFRDNGVLFDPTRTSIPDTTAPLKKRQPGGLGLFFVKKFSDAIVYENLDGTNQTTVTKTLR